MIIVIFMTDSVKTRVRFIVVSVSDCLFLISFVSNIFITIIKDFEVICSSKSTFVSTCLSMTLNYKFDLEVIL